MEKRSTRIAELESKSRTDREELELELLKSMDEYYREHQPQRCP